MKKPKQKDLIFEYYQERPNKAVKHADSVPWATAEYEKRTGKIFKDPDRAIRTLYSEGKLAKLGKGLYRYDPKMLKEPDPPPFTQKIKDEIFRRDGHRCVVCGNGRREGHEICADHICPRSKGGESTVENGQTLCAVHNNLKGNLNQTTSGKKMFLILQKLAIKKNDEKTAEFCRRVLEVYKELDINGHIPWE